MIGSSRFIYVVCFLVVSSSILSWCGVDVDTDVQWSGDVQQFTLQVAPVASFGMKGWFKKSGIVTTAEQVTVSAQVPWRVTQITGKIWSKTHAWQQIISLEDTAWTVSFAVKRATVGLESAKDLYNQQALGLEKALFDTQIGFERNRITSDTTKTDIAKQQEKLQKDLKDTDLSNPTSNLSLQLDKLNNDLTKAQLDYQTKIDADNQTIQNFINTVKLLWTDLHNLFSDTVEQTDNLLGYTPAKRSANDAFETMLGNKDFFTKAKAEESFRLVIAAYDEFKMLVSDIHTGSMVPLLQSYQKGVNRINTSLSDTNSLLLMTEPGGTALPKSQYDTFKLQFDGLKAKASGLWSSITNQINGINSFFATYKQSQESLAKSIDGLKQQVEITTRSLQDAEYNAKLWASRQTIWFDATLQNQELSDRSNIYNAEFSVKNNEIALDNLWNSLNSAQIAYQEASFAREKFNVKSPIQWTVTDILVDKGQEVTPGTPLFTVVNTLLTQVELDITAWEKELIVPWQVVELDQWWFVGKWIIESVSEVADRNFWYKVVVVITEWKFDIWSSVQVSFLWSLGENIIVPLNAVTIVDNGRGVVQLWRWWKLTPVTIGLGSLAGEYVIVTDGLNIDDLIITSDTSNFDPEKMEVRVDT